MISLFNTTVSRREMALVADVLGTGHLVMGNQVAGLERELEAYLGNGVGAVTCASGTDALALILEQLGCQGTGVVVPAMTFSATYEAVLKVGAVPVLCDIDETTGSPTITQIRDAMVSAVYGGTAISAIIVVHLYGWPVFDIAEIVAFCTSHNILLIEDCAHCFGASWEGHRLGTIGDAAAFSFYPTKTLGGIGDGGAAVFRRQDYAVAARALRNHGRVDGIQLSPGYNSRLDEVNAAVLRHRLEFYQENILARRALSGRYHQNGVKKMSIKRHGNGVPYVYPVLVDNREGVRFRLAEAGVETRVHYDPPVSGLSYVHVDCPNAKFFAGRVLSLPCHHGMTLEDVDLICDALRKT